MMLNGFVIRPSNSELCESSLEDLCIAIVRLRDKTGQRINIVPTKAIFTEECLRKFFGWVDADFR